MLDLISVNVAVPAIIGMSRGNPVLSGILKRPVEKAFVRVSPANIEGDAQADLRNHGGPDKAIYAYSADHYPWWTAQMGPAQPYRPGAFGENLTLAGVDESDVHIGDIWQWGSAILQVCQPRYPCFKLALATERPKIVKRFLESGRSGFYIRVLEPGEAPVCGPITVQEEDSDGITVREAALAVYEGATSARQLEIAGHPALAASWAAMLRHLGEPAA